MDNITSIIGEYTNEILYHVSFQKLLLSAGSVFGVKTKATPQKSNNRLHILLLDNLMLSNRQL